MSYDLESETPKVSGISDADEIFGATASPHQPASFGFAGVWDWLLAKFSGSAADVKSALGIGTIAEQAANSVSLTGGTIGSGVIISIADDGDIIDATSVEGALQENRLAIDSIEEKTDFLTVTGAVDLDTVSTKSNFLTVTGAVDLDGIKAKSDFISVTQPVNLDSLEALSSALGRNVHSASELLKGEEGVAIHFVSRTYLVGDYAGTLADAGHSDEALTVSRASSATYVGRDRLIKTASSNVLRYDHEPATGRPLGLLVEGARTNLALSSEAIDNATHWSVTRSTVTADDAVAPDGATTADKLVEDSTSADTHMIAVASAISFTTSVNYTFSIWAKADERSWIAIELHTQESGNVWGGRPYAYFNLSTGSVGTSANCTAKIEEYADGWYRCSIVATATSSGSNSPGIRLAESDSADSYDGDGASGVHVWGAQIEAGAHASSYIATTTASATRAADSVSIATSEFPIDIDNFTIYARFRPADADLGGTGAQRIITLQGASPSDDSAFFSVSTGGVLEYAQFSAASMVVNESGLATIEDGFEFSAAASVRPDDVKMLSAIAAADTSAAPPTALATLHIGADSVGVPFFGHIAESMVVNRAMTAAELESLTA